MTDYTDLKARLRSINEKWLTHPIAVEAADAIEALEAETRVRDEHDPLIPEVAPKTSAFPTEAQLAGWSMSEPSRYVTKGDDDG